MSPLIGRLFGGLGLLAAVTYLAMLAFVPVPWATVVAGMAALGLAARVYDLLALDRCGRWLLPPHHATCPGQPEDLGPIRRRVA